MTTPAERTRSVLGMGEVAEQLLPYTRRKTRTVPVPADLLRGLACWLRHYPTSADMDEAARRAPKVFGRDRP